MCGRFTLRTAASAIAEQFELLGVPEFGARFNIAPSQPVPVIRMQSESPQGDGGRAAESVDEHEKRCRRSSSVPLATSRELVWLRWGLVPSWAKDPAISNRLINARAESAAEKPAFRAAMRRRRCLIVADGFYEWRQGGGAGRRGGEEGDSPIFAETKIGTVPRAKQPYLIRLRGDRPFAFAGLWEAWEASDHTALETCTILTTAANDLVRPIHDRMPVILRASGYTTWLDPAIDDPRQLMPLLAPYASDEMEAQPVGDFVNSPTHDSPQCVEPMLQKGNMILPGF
jgi:putative SOS response-associated peptidase YedK